MNKKNGVAEDSRSPICYASDWDHRIIDATSISLGDVGREDDLNRLRRAIEDGEGNDKLKTACEVAMAFIRWSQDLKQERDTYRDRKCVHDLAKEYAEGTTGDY